MISGSYDDVKSKWLDTHGIDEDFQAHIPGGIGSQSAVDFFRNLFEPPTRGETSSGYTFRLKTMANRFIALSPFARRCVIAHRDDGLFWRGEHMAQFKHIAELSAVLKDEGLDKFRIRCVKGAKEMVLRLNEINPEGI